MWISTIWTHVVMYERKHTFSPFPSRWRCTRRITTSGTVWVPDSGTTAFVVLHQNIIRNAAFRGTFPSSISSDSQLLYSLFFTMQGDAGENRNPKPIALGDSVLVVEFQHPFFRPPLLSMCLLSAFPALLRLELFDMVRSLNSTLTWEGQVATFSHSPFLGSKTVPMWRV